MSTITWSAQNNSTYLVGDRKATSMRTAVIAARAYLNSELYGEGTITYYKDGLPVREDERSIFTRFRLVTRKIQKQQRIEK